jgi:YidC/Oxa1 family membrane protein insertase
MTSLFGVPLDAVYHLVSGFTAFLTPALGGLAAVAAIVAFTVAVRIILMPLSFRAMRGQAVQARLAPQLQALRKRYAKQPERLQREMAALYKREGTSMFAGLTPLLLQWPLVSVIYLLFRSPQVGGKPNMLLTHHLLGVPLGSYWLGGAGPLSPHGLVFLGIFALLAGLCWLSSRLGQLMTAQATAPSEPARPALALAAKAGPARRAPVKAVPAATSAKATSAKATSAKATSARGTSAKATPAKAAPVPGGALIKVLPYLTVVIAAFAPLAAGIYLIVSTGWSLAERRFFWRSGRFSAAATRQPGTPEKSSTIRA